MTEVTVKLKDDSKLDILLAFLGRLGSSEEVKVAVERNGRGVALGHSPEDDARFEHMVNQIIQDALAGKMEQLTPEEEDAEDEELAAYGEQTMRIFGVLTDDDIVRIINEDRKEQRERAAA
jgi:hypothetical protein